ncbi:uncharacterized protein LOC118485827 [Helianthus annuus]|uniref:uncharacterized protein LOC118485827 n=1 Tax=Helianthus annuus TaxID=4232 RepID=UPI001653078E|nr:uncharacterized protein LOC118485827 [Helianthus annuus]
MSGELKKEMFTAEDMYQITVEENKSNASPSTPKALVVEDYDWSEEITEAKEQVSKALMAKISSESSARKFEKQTTGIPTGNNDADKGLKGILPSVKSGDQTEKDAEKGKDKAQATAMKADASKEKADKDLIPLSVKKMCAMMMETAEGQK